MVRLFSSGRKFFSGAVAAVLLAIHAPVVALPPVVSNPVVADVTDRSLSLIWTTDQPGQAQIQVFADAAGTVPVNNIEYVVYPLATGDPSLSDDQREQSRQQIIAAAGSMGIVKVRIQGLAAHTDYYLKYGYENAAAEITLCPDAGTSYCPAQTELVQVHTATMQRRDYTDGGTQMLLNDLLLMGDIDIAAGELLIVGVENTQYPVSVFAGDGISLPYYLIDLNNLYQQGETLRIRGVSRSLMGTHGEGLIVRRYRGQLGSSTHLARVDAINGSGQTIDSVDIAYGDCNADSRIDGYDLLQIRHYLAGHFVDSDFDDVAFHAVFCNLFAEQGRDSVNTQVIIDQSDADQLSRLLIGTLNASSLPVQP